jgi:hypothetical protein
MPQRPSARNRSASVVRVVLSITILSMIAPRAAHAYVDPVPGSMIFQIVAAGLLGAALITKHWWGRAVASARALVARVGRR